MNTEPITTAQDSDLRMSFAALERAALRAHALAAQTGTTIVISRNGVVEQLTPTLVHGTAGIQEPPTSYRASE
jgi:hypothetical protein